MQSIMTNVVQASLVMCLHIDFILMKLAMRSGPTLNGSCAALLSCCFDPNNM